MAALVGMLITAFVGSASAQNDPNLDIKLVAKKVVKDSQGKEQMLPGNKAKPGEVLEYTASYRNKTDDTLRKLAPTVPIPAGTKYIGGSAKPKIKFATIDGANFLPVPLMKTVTSADGKQVRVKVAPSEYRAVRWAPVDLPAKQTVTVKMRTRIDPADAPTTAAKQ